MMTLCNVEIKLKGKKMKEINYGQKCSLWNATSKQPFFLLDDGHNNTGVLTH